MIGADHKLIGVRHDLVAISQFVSRKYRKCAIAMVALSILVGTISLLAL
jgi:succinate dehydrogenase/fumarate reductase cytochrome b subunit